MTPCSSEKATRFRGTYQRHLQGRLVSPASGKQTPASFWFLAWASLFNDICFVFKFFVMLQLSYQFLDVLC
jgi:hypothetical protein